MRAMRSTTRCARTCAGLLKWSTQASGWHSCAAMAPCSAREPTSRGRPAWSVERVRARRLKAFAAYHALEALPMPSVAVVHGAALGSGVEIAAACDFIVATPDAAFGTPEAMRGTVGATQRR